MNDEGWECLPGVQPAEKSNISPTPSFASAMHRVPSASQLSDTGEEIELKTLKRSASGLQLVDLSDAERLSGTWSWDVSKTRGHSFDTPSLLHALLFCLDPNSNEFWNVFTEILPILHLGLVALELAGVLDLGHDLSGGSPQLRRAVIGTLLGAAAQHACSLVAHAGRSVSPRLSHSIWYVDFAGIFINNVWNVAPLVYVIAPSLAITMPRLESTMLAASICCSTLLLWLGLRQAIVYKPDGGGGGGIRDNGDRVTILNFVADAAGGPRYGMLVVLALVLPNAILSVLTGLYVDGRGPLPLLGFASSFAIKVSNAPNRWARAGFFDFSPLHSHALWHFGVWASQSIYILIYLSVMATPARQ